MADDNITLDIHQFIKSHLFVKNWINYRQHVYEKSDLLLLIGQIMELFKMEKTLATISPPVTIVGDIHGQYPDLVRILNSRISKEEAKQKIVTSYSSNRFVFLGDYVDRGNHSIECICLVFALKVLDLKFVSLLVIMFQIAYPTNFVLLRGNHETKAINFAYGFREELENRLGKKDGFEIWEKFNEVFSFMPLACLVGGRILCMHGGISEKLESLDSIDSIVRPLPEVTDLAQDLLWSDPMDVQTLASISDTPKYAKNIVRGLAHSFNDAAVRDVCRRLNLHLVVRAHQMIPEGFKFNSDRKLLTIFSAPRYMNESDNRGATLQVDVNGQLSISVMRYTKPLRTKALGSDEITRGDHLPDISRKKSNSFIPSTFSSSKSTSLKK
ncbi:Serine/threonine-protein phosphatase [Caenorhabditis elegans]|uniref:Serine/threonine-protein phosphatase n=1 Tax=Caenorhabditis elegans TaxID=6239 RepID=P91273_CAEEL|nr:Serine/threonine-protein phosphatase [Caenorhabditis elegans]CCD64197.1 Serine/threonine-protein phosphatase [Caenorhabditis elegans]|eukprot:NP_001040654.1 Serine/threonine-protein phosphatase [Caenorhabditis elegans]